MAKLKYDGVIEAVHYQSDGQVDWVRVYVRHGFVFSDRVHLTRQELIDQIKSGKRFVVGKRVPYMGASFEVSQPVQIVQVNNHEVLAVDAKSSIQDSFEGVPVI